jgi:hypothetical protein
LSGFPTTKRTPNAPQSWRALYKHGDEWKPEENAGPYGIEKDRYNKVAFKPVAQ